MESLDADAQGLVRRGGLSVLFALALGGCAKADDLSMRIAGMASATIDSKGRVSAHAEGCAVFAEDGRTCARVLTQDSVVRVASISKLVVAIAVMRLVESGKIELDRDVAAYLSFKLRNPAFPEAKISLRQLLTHTSSLRDGAGYAIPLGVTLQTEASVPEHWEAGHVPGDYFSYANINFAVIGTVMEAATGERFDRLMQRLVLEPLQIDGCFNWALCSQSAVERAATLYRTGPDETRWDPAGPWVAQVDDLKGHKPDCAVLRRDASVACNLESYQPGRNGALFSPQGGLRISILGLAKIARLIAGAGEVDGVRLLRASTVHQMLAPQWWYAPSAANGDTESGSMCAYGLSLQLTARVRDPACRDDVFGDGRPRAGHLGEAYGLFGGVWLDAETKRAAIYLITGTSRDPKSEPGRHSAFTRVEEAAAEASR